MSLAARNHVADEARLDDFHAGAAKTWLVVPTYNEIENLEPSVIWFYKLDLDPEIAREFSSWRDVDYVVTTVVMRGEAEDNEAQFRKVAKEVNNSRLLIGFGQEAQRVEIRKVKASAQRAKLSDGTS